MKSQGTSKVGEINWNCRFHPNEGWHEVGCPHKEWTKEQLQDALETAKGSSNMAIEAIQQAIAQERERIAEEIYKLYPPTFIEEKEYGKGVITSGKQEATHIRRLTTDEKGVLTNVLSIITNNHE